MRDVPRVKSVMTPFPFSVEAGDPLRRACALMEEHGFHHLPVKRGGELVGVVSERRARRELAAAGEDRQPLVERATDTDALVVDLGARLDTVALAMAERHVDSALVVKDGKLVGIFTATDACRCLGRYLREEFPLPGGDHVA